MNIKCWSTGKAILNHNDEIVLIRLQYIDVIQIFTCFCNWAVVTRYQMIDDKLKTFVKPMQQVLHDYPTQQI